MPDKKEKATVGRRRGQEKLRFDKLAAYKGPKAARWLRRSVKQQIHDLFEELTILRLLDPRVEEDLRRFKMLEPMEIYAKVLGRGRRD